MIAFKEMMMLDKKLFSENFTLLCEMFDKKQTRGLMIIYYEVLKNLSDEEFKKAITKLLSTWEYSYMPKPKHILDMTAPDSADIEEIANRAYKTAKETAIYQGCYISPDFEDEIISDVIDSYFGSWFNFHNKVAYRDSDDTFVKKDFIRAYKRKAETKNIRAVKLIGYGANPRDLSIKADYELPIKRDELIQLENKSPVNSLVANLTKLKRM